MQPFAFHPIGVIESCYKENFGIPRQAGLAPSALSKIILPLSSEWEAAVEGLSEFSHIWVIFVFHDVDRTRPWRPKVRPPRLGGRKKGVLATRSPHRPNPIGISAVKLEKVEIEQERIVLTIRGGDFLDQTPVLDVKPYLDYADKISDASTGWTSSAPVSQPKIEILFLPTVLESCKKWESSAYPDLIQLIQETLALDPRPQIQIGQVEATQFGCRIFDFDIRWKVEDGRFIVYDVEKLTASSKS